MTVPSILNPDAQVAIIYGNVSVEDEAQGNPFSSKASQLILKYLSGAGISSSNCSIIPIFRDRIKPGQYLRLEEKAIWNELLKRDLGRIKPNILISLGDDALSTLTGFMDCSKYRGSVLQCSIEGIDAKVICMEDHERINEDPKLNPIFFWDAQKCARHMHTKDLLRKPLEIIITKDLSIYEEEFLNDTYLADPTSLLSFDIESCDKWLTCIGFAKSPNKAYVLPLSRMLDSELPAAYRLIDRIMRSPVKKVAQNGNFDITFLAHFYGICVKNFYWDTMLCWHSMFSTLPKGLDFLNSLFTNEPYWKDEGKDWRGQEKFTAEQWRDFFEYNGKDVANTLEIALAQATMLADRGTEAIFQQEMDLCYPLITMELLGVKADLSKKEMLKEKNRKQVGKASLFLHHLVGGDPSIDTWEKANSISDYRKEKKKAHPLEALNISSPKMMKDYLYNKMKLPKRVKKGKITADEDALITLQKFGHELIGTILFLRKHKKKGSFFTLKVGDDNRIRCTFKPGGTETGRLSSSKSITKSGTNLQNIPKEIRVFFVADDGYVFVQPDYAKAESWIVAYLADDDKMLEALQSADFHSTNASKILGKPVDKSMYTDRQLGKKISHAANYRVTPFTMVKALAKDGYIFTKTECQEMLDAYFRAYPRVKAFQENTIDELRKKDFTLTSPWGRKITFFKHWGTDLFNAACAFKPQSTVGDMTNRGLINLYNAKDIDGMLLLQVHDSIPLQVKKEHLTQELVDKIKSYMSVEITVRGTTFTIPVDIECGPNWYELEDWDKYKKQHNLQ
jgi:DNA polymerase-1